MVLYDKETQRNRKQYIKTKEQLAILDQFVKPTQSRIIEHPRFHNKPYSCELGRHDLFTDSMMGIPFLTCRKCGWTTLKSAHEGNETKRELKENVPHGQTRTFLTDDIVDLFYPERRRW
jgi:hypothetical protein